jgi:hypothetical protein
VSEPTLAARVGAVTQSLRGCVLHPGGPALTWLRQAQAFWDGELTEADWAMLHTLVVRAALDAAASAQGNEADQQRRVALVADALYGHAPRRPPLAP